VEAAGGLMPRPRRSAGKRVEFGFDLHLELTIGPSTHSLEELELGWRCHGNEVMEDYVGPPGTRPWGWWAFEAGEELPRERWNSEAGRLENRGAETVRLAELGELTDSELAALRERANEARLRIGTPREVLSDGPVDG